MIRLNKQVYKSAGRIITMKLGAVFSRAKNASPHYVVQKTALIPKRNEVVSIQLTLSKCLNTHIVLLRDHGD